MNFINLVDLYSYHIFDQARLPEGVDRELTVNAIMDMCALYTPLYTEEHLLVAKINTFFAKNYDVFNRIYKATLLDYDPIENYNRFEMYTDTTNLNTKSVVGGASNAVNSSTGDNTSMVSPYDAGTFVNDSKDVSTNKSTITASNTDTTTNTGTNSLSHDAHIHGNIGVTTSQQMLESELEVRPKLNIYTFIASAFFAEFCLYDL